MYNRFRRRMQPTGSCCNILNTQMALYLFQKRADYTDDFLVLFPADTCYIRVSIHHGNRFTVQTRGNVMCQEKLPQQLSDKAPLISRFCNIHLYTTKYRFSDITVISPKHLHEDLFLIIEITVKTSR